VAILREVHYKGYITIVYEPVVVCNVLNVKSIWFKYTLKCGGSKDLLIDWKACMKVVLNSVFEVLAEVLMRIQV
jgi:hypothetical protein